MMHLDDTTEVDETAGDEPFGQYRNRDPEDAREIAEDVVEQTADVMPPGIEVSVERRGLYHVVEYTRKSSADAQLSQVNQHLQNSGIAADVDEYKPINGYLTELWIGSRIPKSELEAYESKITEQLEERSDIDWWVPETHEYDEADGGLAEIHLFQDAHDEDTRSMFDIVDDHLYHDIQIEIRDEETEYPFWAIVFEIRYTEDVA